MLFSWLIETKESPTTAPTVRTTMVHRTKMTHWRELCPVRELL
jgi:hypothetical protein